MTFRPVTCNACGHAFHVVEPVFTAQGCCPGCGTWDAFTVAGEPLTLEQVKAALTPDGAEGTRPALVAADGAGFTRVCWLTLDEAKERWPAQANYLDHLQDLPQAERAALLQGHWTHAEEP